MKPSELLADEKKWTKGANAKDTKGNRVSAFDPDAACFCAWGAIRLCFNNDVTQIWILRDKIEQKFCFHLTSWNDAPERTHAEVIAVLKECGL